MMHLGPVVAVLGCALLCALLADCAPTCGKIHGKLAVKPHLLSKDGCRIIRFWPCPEDFYCEVCKPPADAPRG
jgi:hypothetical protein